MVTSVNLKLDKQIWLTLAQEFNKVYIIDPVDYLPGWDPESGSDSEPS